MADQDPGIIDSALEGAKVGFATGGLGFFNPGAISGFFVGAAMGLWNDIKSISHPTAVEAATTPVAQQNLAEPKPHAHKHPHGERVMQTFESQTPDPATLARVTELMNSAHVPGNDGQTYMQQQGQDLTKAVQSYMRDKGYYGSAADDKHFDGEVDGDFRARSIEAFKKFSDDLKKNPETSQTVAAPTPAPVDPTPPPVAPVVAPEVPSGKTTLATQLAAAPVVGDDLDMSKVDEKTGKKLSGVNFDLDRAGFQNQYRLVDGASVRQEENIILEPYLKDKPKADQGASKRAYYEYTGDPAREAEFTTALHASEHKHGLRDASGDLNKEGQTIAESAKPGYAERGGHRNPFGFLKAIGHVFHEGATATKDATVEAVTGPVIRPTTESVYVFHPKTPVQGYGQGYGQPYNGNANGASGNGGSLYGNPNQANRQANNQSGNSQQTADLSGRYQMKTHVNDLRGQMIRKSDMQSEADVKGQLEGTAMQQEIIRQKAAGVTIHLDKNGFIVDGQVEKDFDAYSRVSPAAAADFMGGVVRGTGQVKMNHSLNPNGGGKPPMQRASIGPQ